MMKDLISGTDKVPLLCGRIVTGDKKWCFLHNLQSTKILEMWIS